MTGTLIITQQVPAPPQQVYDAWLSADGLASWWWPGFGDTTYEVDARAGGSYRIRSEQAGIGVHGSYVSLDPPRRIEMTWFWSDAEVVGPEEHVRVDLSAQGSGTLVTVTHRVADPTGVDPYRSGWEHVLGTLARDVPRPHGPGGAGR